MHYKHRRAPSAMPSAGYNPTDEEPTISFTSNLTFDPPQIQVFEVPDKDYLKSISKTTTKADHNLNKKFFHNSSISYNNEYCSFLSSSAENIFKEMNQLHELNEEDEASRDDMPENPLFDLSDAIEEIMNKRDSITNKILISKRSIKVKLATLFCQNEVSDIDTERRIDSVRCSGDTVEGPGSSYHVDDFSLVKFDISVDNFEKKTKTVKFKGFY